MTQARNDELMLVFILMLMLMLMLMLVIMLVIGQRAEDRGQLTGSGSCAKFVGGKLERYQAKIGVPPNSWRTRFTPLGETSYFAIFSAAARWKAYIIDEPIISTRSSPLRPSLYGRSI